jgi:LemA protein
MMRENFQGEGMTAYIALAVVVVIVIWAIALYNRLRTHKNQVENAFAQIDVQLKRRHDLIPNLVEVARGYMQHEAQTLEAVIRARGEAVSAADKARQSPGKAQAMGALMAAEQVLGGQVGRLMALAEAYPAQGRCPHAAAQRRDHQHREPHRFCASVL